MTTLRYSYKVEFDNDEALHEFDRWIVGWKAQFARCRTLAQAQAMVNHWYDVVEELGGRWHDDKLFYDEQAAQAAPAGGGGLGSALKPLRDVGEQMTAGQKAQQEARERAAEAQKEIVVKISDLL